MITFEEIEKARKRISPYIHKTPLMLSETLSNEVGTKIYVKLESLQKTGAFKIRGIFNKLLSLKETQSLFFTASSGNHGYGLAYASRELGLKAKVIVPEYTPERKWKAIALAGTEVIRRGSNWNESFEIAQSLSKKENAKLIHPFDDDDIINGQGTIALEIVEDIPEKPDFFLASIGGGSMISSNALVLKQMSPKTKVIGLQTFGADAMYQSIQKGEIVQLESITSKVESFATLAVSKRTFELTQKFVDEIIRLEDKDCQKATVFMLKKANILLELSASICVAAVLNKKFSYAKDSVIVLTLCGGNYDLSDLEKDVALF